MRTALGLAAIAAVMGISTQGYALDQYSDLDQQRFREQQRWSEQQRYNEQQRLVENQRNVPSEVTGGWIVEGDVTRVDADSYVIRDSTGRELRAYFEPTTARENIKVGDHVIAKFDRPSAPYATSILRRPAEMSATPTGALPRPQAIEGEVQRIEADNYVIRDLTGKEIRLHVDKTTKLDGNLTPGDKVVARVVSPPSNTPPYARTMYKLNSAEALEGQVIGIEGNTYIVRDLNGAEQRVFADSATSGSPVMIGDRVVVVRGSNAPMAHAEAISKR
jgi:uncharacterized protein YdeI (BOF family)